ncbi:thermonuclease family protein [Candidatus Collierbacteria bacterium]|nr:thermonuclease family protein [Candidatus Collierbacteria bacterium]
MTKKKTKVGKNKQIIAGALVTAALSASAGWWVLKSGVISFPVPAYQVEKVIDGDTFITKENVRVRLASIGAPEIGDCGGEEAKAKLSRYIINKPLYLKVLYTDPYNRIVSHVYTKDGFVNKMLAEGGYVYFDGSSERSEGIREVAEKAKEKKLGIFGPKCTQTTNPKNQKCVIKGNRRLHGGGTSIYRFPGCYMYDEILVQLYLGDEWFCDQKQAQKAGFIKGQDCLDKTWP